MGRLYEVSIEFGQKILRGTTAKRNTFTAPDHTAVIDKDLSTPPGGESPGDRYIVAPTGAGAWLNHDNEIAEWNGASYAFTVPNVNEKVVVTDEGLTYVFMEAAWDILQGLIFFNEDVDVVEYFDGANWLQLYDTVLNKFDATTAPTASDDSGDGYEVGSRWIDVSADKAYVCVDATATSAVWIETTQSGSIQTPIEISIGGNTAPQFSTSSTSYVVATVFRFAGTTALGTPTAMKAIGFKDASPTSWDVQIFDATNANIIATKTGNTGTASELVDVGTLSNLPTGAAIFEVQLKRTGGTGGSMVHAQTASIDF